MKNKSEPIPSLRSRLDKKVIKGEDTIDIFDATVIGESYAMDLVKPVYDLIEKAFKAGKNKTSWQDFKKEHNL